MFCHPDHFTRPWPTPQSARPRCRRPERPAQVPRCSGAILPTVSAKSVDPREPASLDTGDGEPNTARLFRSRLVGHGRTNLNCARTPRHPRTASRVHVPHHDPPVQAPARPERPVRAERQASGGRQYGTNAESRTHTRAAPRRAGPIGPGGVPPLTRATGPGRPYPSPASD
jgi:hypothetical protein